MLNMFLIINNIVSVVLSPTKFVKFSELLWNILLSMSLINAVRDVLDIETG